MHNKTKNKKSFIALVLGIIVVTISAVLCFTLSRINKDTAPPIPEITFDGDMGYSSGQNAKDVVVHATTGFIFNADSLNQTVDIDNPEQNNCDFIVSIYLGDGTLIYESEYIHPGDCITEIQVTQALRSGVYRNSVIAYNFCSADDSHTILSQCEFPIEIRCIN